MALEERGRRMGWREREMEGERSGRLDAAAERALRMTKEVGREG